MTTKRKNVGLITVFSLTAIAAGLLGSAGLGVAIVLNRLLPYLTQ